MFGRIDYSPARKALNFQMNRLQIYVRLNSLPACIYSLALKVLSLYVLSIIPPVGTVIGITLLGASAVLDIAIVNQIHIVKTKVIKSLDSKEFAKFQRQLERAAAQQTTLQFLGRWLGVIPGAGLVSNIASILPNPFADPTA